MDTFKEIKKYFRTIRDLFQHHPIRPTYIITNNYLIRRMGLMDTWRHVCTLEDRQEMYRDIIQCAALEVFEGEEKLMYYDPFRTTYAGSYPSHFRPHRKDGIHYVLHTPITFEWRNAILRGICRPQGQEYTYHQDDYPVCRGLFNSSEDSSTSIPPVECHLGCRCAYTFLNTSYCKKFLKEFKTRKDRATSPSKCYNWSVPEAVIMGDYKKALAECGKNKKSSSIDINPNCYTHNDAYHRRWKPTEDIMLKDII
eukprot:PhF_6_TR5272/c0_g1_i2/m.7678